MKNPMKMVLGSFAVMTLLSTVSFASSGEYANPEKGKSVYQKMFYKACGITCTAMAKKHTQSEWENAYKAGKVQELINKYCSIMDDLNPNEQKLIYDYMYYAAKDSGHVEPCSD